ncbi:hypothetical protein [Nocardia asiatica]|uniref:hypothetical protein n=1 Tax=Nocardia asiatica TaxID=209252 RepID=UPI0002E6A788
MTATLGFDTRTPGCVPAHRVATPNSPRDGMPRSGGHATDTNPLAADGDVHIRIWLAEVCFDYLATAAAAHMLTLDWARRQWFAIELIFEMTDADHLLPRLPCERLFSGP